MVNFLLSRNSNPQSKDVRGITPQDLAQHKGTRNNNNERFSCNSSKTLGYTKISNLLKLCTEESEEKILEIPGKTFSSRG